MEARITYNLNELKNGTLFILPNASGGENIRYKALGPAGPGRHKVKRIDTGKEDDFVNDTRVALVQ